MEIHALLKQVLKETKMRFMTITDIRADFLAYFREQGHTEVASASLLPEGDQTLLFTNAGMVPFGGRFLGLIRVHTPEQPAPALCARGSIMTDQVGYTKRHHNF